MIHRLIRFGKRQIHTIVSSQIIKPSSPTPSRSKTYNLSILDQFCERSYIPIVAFYPNTGKTLDLKNSLSQTLTNYYPFAGRFDKTKPAYVHCNDDGVEFLEASVDATLSDFLQNSRHEDMDRFFPHNLVWSKSMFRRGDGSEKLVRPLAVQVNRFECGGVAVAASLSHKIGDASSLLHFLSDWAKTTRNCSTSSPEFVSFPSVDLNIDGFPVERSNDSVTRSFTFPNLKINSLKLKVKALTEESGQPFTHLTRTEVLNWLLFKCAVAASSKDKSNPAGSFEPAVVNHAINIRGKLLEPLPTKTIGNFSMIMRILANTETEMKPGPFIRELKKQKLQFQGLKNIESAFVGLNEMFSVSAEQDQQPAKKEKSYLCSSLSGRDSLYDVDFGWGKPVKATFAGIAGTNSFVLVDTPNQDGIEALVCLLKQDMDIFQTDPDLRAFC